MDKFVAFAITSAILEELLSATAQREGRMDKEKQEKQSEIIVDPEALQKAFYQHKQAFKEKKEGTNSAPYNLLLFYAVECGLKALYMSEKRRQLKGVYNVAEIKKFRHDLIKLVSELKIPGAVAEGKRHFRLQNEKRTRTWEIKEIHIAWRYGAIVDSNDERKVVEWLDKLCIWIENKMRTEGRL